MYSFIAVYTLNRLRRYKIAAPGALARAKVKLYHGKAPCGRYHVKHAKEHQPTIVGQSEPSQPPILGAGRLVNRVIGQYKPTNRFASEPGELDIDPGHDHGLDAGYGDFPKNIYGATLHPHQLNRRV